MEPLLWVPTATIIPTPGTGIGRHQLQPLRLLCGAQLTAPPDWSLFPPDCAHNLLLYNIHSVLIQELHHPLKPKHSLIGSPRGAHTHNTQDTDTQHSSYLDTHTHTPLLRNNDRVD